MRRLACARHGRVAARVAAFTRASKIPGGALSPRKLRRSIHKIDLPRARFVNSLILAACVATIAVGVGTPLAWLARPHRPSRRAERCARWSSLRSSRRRSLARKLGCCSLPRTAVGSTSLGGAHPAEQGPLNIYSLAGAIFVMALYNIPYTFTFVVGRARVMPAEMEDAAAILGAGSLRRTLSITLPLALPAIIAGFIMSFLEALVGVRRAGISVDSGAPASRHDAALPVLSISHRASSLRPPTRCPYLLITARFCSCSAA